MEYRFTIEGRNYRGTRVLPDLNDYLRECSTHPNAGGNMKRKYQQIACTYIRRQLRNVHIDKKVHITYVHYEYDTKRDKSNIASMSMKVIEDALQQCKVLKNDNWNCVENFSHEFHIDKRKPRIEVIIKEL